MQKYELPRIIHTIWAGGNKPLPPEGIVNIAKWALYNPSFSVILWVDTKQPPQEIDKIQRHYLEQFNAEYTKQYFNEFKKNPDTIPEIQIKDIREKGVCLDNDDLVDYCLDRIIPNYGMSSDILRYRLLYKYGGMYVDVTDVESAPKMQNLEQIPEWGKQSQHVLFIDHLSQNRAPSQKDKKEFKIPEVGEVTGIQLDIELSETKIGNDTFICTVANPLMLKMIEIVESGFKTKSLDEMMGRVNTLHNMHDSTIAITGPQVPQKAICLASTGRIKSHVENAIIKCINEDEVLIRPVRCDTYELTVPAKNTRNWSNVSIDITTISNITIAFEKLEKMVKFEIDNMGILRLDDHFRDLYHVANKLKLDPSKTCQEFLQYIEEKMVVFSKVQIVQNVDGNAQLQEFYKRKNLLSCDLLRKVNDVGKALDCYQDITCFNFFTGVVMFKRLSEVTTDLINRYQLPGEQRAIFDKIVRAVNFLYLIKSKPNELPVFEKMLRLPPQKDITPLLGSIMNTFTNAFLEPGKEISKSQIGDVLIKLKEMGVSNPLIQEYSNVRDIILKEYKGDPGLCLRNFANKNDEKKLEILLKYFDVDVNAVSLSNRQTALHYAASKGHQNVVRLLLKNGADSSKEDKDQKTPHDIVHPSCLDLLPKAGHTMTDKK